MPRILPALALLALLPVASAIPSGAEGRGGIPLGDQRPMVAVWRQSEGHRLGSEAPYLRVAVWEDGRVLVAEDPSRWGPRLREGRIPARRVEQLSRDLLKSGVFDLRGTCYLVPDAPVDCILVVAGGRRQMLYWDEVESPRYGINIAPKPHHLAFKECWKRVNALALACRPERSSALPGRFGPVPTSWVLRPAIQSE